MRNCGRTELIWAFCFALTSVTSGPFEFNFFGNFNINNPTGGLARQSGPEFPSAHSPGALCATQILSQPKLCKVQFYSVGFRADTEKCASTFSALATFCCMKISRGKRFSNWLRHNKAFFVTSGGRASFEHFGFV